MERFLWQGFVIGLAIAAPVGPIGLLCIQRTLSQGRAAGFASGLGAATADAFYGSVAAFGLSLVSSFLLEQRRGLGLIGGLFLLGLATRTFLARPSTQTESDRSDSLVSAYATTFLLTLTNPATILSFAAIFAGLGLAEQERDSYPAAMLVSGVFTGSAIWWLLLSGAVSIFRSRFTAAHMRWVNRLAGVIIGAFGLLALSQIWS